MDDRASPLDAETKVAERPHDHKDQLRLWLRLFTCKELIESEVRKHLREDLQTGFESLQIQIHSLVLG